MSKENKKIRFGIVSPYPDAQVPEKEIINRIKSIVDSDDYATMYIFNGQGYLLDDKSTHIEDMNLDFVIDSDHSFCSLPVDCFSYMCIWMPSGFASFGLYPNYVFNLNSIDDFLDSYKVKNEAEYLKNICKDTGHIFDDGMHYFSSPGLKKLVIEPKKITKYKLFYSGLNVERILHQNGKTVTKNGRHHQLFSELDKRGYMQFHGPSILAGINPWDGFSKYAGEIPFDGKSLFKEINNCGVSLVLHYKAHEYRGLPTTRIFESCLSGAIIIADDFPFTRNTFGDSIFLIDPSKPADKVAEDIDKIMDWINANPIEALNKAKASQNVFLNKLAKTDVVRDLCNNHFKRKEEILKKLHKPLNNDLVDLIVPFKNPNKENILNIIKQIKKQSYLNINVVIICSKESGDFVEKNLEIELTKKTFSFKVIRTKLFKWPVASKTTGELIIESKPFLKGKYFCILEDNHNIHEMHISTLANRIVQKESLQAVYSGTFYKFNDTRLVKNNRPISIQEISSFYKYYDVLKNNAHSKLFDDFERKFLKSSVLFKREILDSSCENELKFIDGCEHIYFLIKGICKSGLASFSFTHRVSSGLNLNLSQNELSEDMEKELYPYRLNFKEHSRVFQTSASQMLDCFISDVNFEEFAVNFYVPTEKHIIEKKGTGDDVEQFKTNLKNLLKNYLRHRPIIKFFFNLLFRMKF